MKMQTTESLALEDYLRGLIDERKSYYPSPFVISAVGGGGKTTTLLHLFCDELRMRSILTTTTSMGTPAAGGTLSPKLSERLRHNKGLQHISLGPPERSGIWFSHAYADVPGKHKGVERHVIDQWVRCERRGRRDDTIVFCEADGAKRKPFKALADHEPVIPRTTDLTLIVFGLSALGQALDESTVHRSSLFSTVTGKAMGDRLSFDDIETVVTGGHFLKDIPLTSKIAVVLNQADTLSEHERADDNMNAWAERLLAHRRVDAVFFTSHSDDGRTTHFGKRKMADLAPPVSAVIMAAGLSTRMAGKNKLLLPLSDSSVIKETVAQSLRSDIRDFVIVTGHDAAAVQSEVGKALEEGMQFNQQVSIVFNRDYEQGQGTSVALGTKCLSGDSVACFFIPGDQPFISPLTIREIIENWEPGKIILPLYDGQQGSPVLFDRVFYPELSELTGDLGGRQVIRHHESDVKEVQLTKPEVMDHLDLDTAEDYESAIQVLSQIEGEAT